MPTYLQHHPDGTKTAVTYSERTPKHVTKANLLLKDIHRCQKDIIQARRRNQSQKSTDKLLNKLKSMELQLVDHCREYPDAAIWIFRSVNFPSGPSATGSGQPGAL